MPRTKQPRKGKQSECERILKEFSKIAQSEILKLNNELKSLEDEYTRDLCLKFSNFPDHICKLTFDELLAMADEPKENQAPAALPTKTPKRFDSSKVGESRKRKLVRTSDKTSRTAASDDFGYQSESTASSSSKTISMTKRRSRSSSRISSKRAKSTSRDRNSKITELVSKKQKDVLKTPNNRPNGGFIITPKVNPRGVVNILRKPRDGEMVFSTSGSPLYVATSLNDKVPNVNVPLKNGNFVSLLPLNSSINESLYLDEETKTQLQILQSQISKVLN